MSTVPLSGVNSRFFFSPIPLSRFSLKMSRFFCIFRDGKMRSFQRQVELRRLGNQLPVLGKANSHCKVVKMLCVWPLRLSLDRVGLGITISRVIVARAKFISLASRRCTTVQTAPPGGVKSTNSRFLRFFVRSVPLFCSLMLTPMIGA